MMLDLVAAIGVLIILGAVMGIAKLNANRLTPEGSRKTIHVVMGCTAMTFPYIFEYRQSVFYLGIVAIAMLLFMRRNEVLRKGVGTALLGVNRKSLGDIYFVIAIVWVFILHQSTFEYLIPIAILTFADSVAALIGGSYGRGSMAEHEEEAPKSREGFVMFFITAFVCALVPLQLMTEVGRAEVLIISFLIGILAAMIEAVCRNGNDNLLLPLLTYSFIRYNPGQSLESLLVNFGFMLFFLIAILIVYKITNFTRLSIAYCLLAAYLIMILGGLSWLLPPATLLLTFGILPMMKTEEKQMKQTYKGIECNTIVGIICLYASVFLPQYRDIFYIAFSLSFAIHLAINTYSRLINFNNTNTEISVIYGFMKSFLFIALPAWAVTRMPLPIFIAYVAFIIITIPFAVYLNKKYDYKNIGDITFNANKILVGSWVSVFVVALIIVGGFYDLFG